MPCWNLRPLRSRMCAADRRAAVEAMIAIAAPPPRSRRPTRSTSPCAATSTDNAGQSPSRILAAHSAAMPELARMIVRPTRRRGWSSPARGVPRISANRWSFRWSPPGKPGGGSAIPDRPRALDRRSDRARIPTRRRPGACRTAQAVGDGRSPGRSMTRGGTEPRPPGQHTPNPRVAVITRTKNRPVLLRRAAQSVASRRSGLHLDVVNDGGDPEEVIGSCARCAHRSPPHDACQPRESQGMEAASNAGSAACDSDYIVIHDDDDSWLPDFLDRTVAFLDSPKRAPATAASPPTAVYVSEEIRGDASSNMKSAPTTTGSATCSCPKWRAATSFRRSPFCSGAPSWTGSAASTRRCRFSATGSSTSSSCWRTTSPSCPRPLARYHHRDRGDHVRHGLCQFRHRRRVETRGIRRRRPQRVSAPSWRQGRRRRLLRHGLRRQRPAGAHRATGHPRPPPGAAPARQRRSALVRGGIERRTGRRGSGAASGAPRRPCRYRLGDLSGA
jgi:hypothetical protein